MSERAAILKLVLSGAIATALALMPLGIKAQEYSDPPAASGKSAAKSKKSASPASTTPDTGGGAKAAKGAKTREPTKGQLEARERQKKCGEEWRDAKAKGTLEKGITWPKYWSACNKRLKGQAA